MNNWTLPTTVPPMMELIWGHPWRSPDAWWQRAIGIIGHEHLPASARIDTYPGRRWIRRAEKYLQAICTANTRRAWQEVALRYPAIYQAHQLYEEAQPKYRNMRRAIEARILARQTDAEIAALQGCSSNTVEAYEALFFNVRKRLKHSDYVNNCLLNPLLLSEATASDRGTHWKVVGYSCGPLMLDAFMAELPKSARAMRSKDVPQCLDGATIGLVKLKAALSAMAITVESNTDLFLVRSLSKQLKLERTTAAKEQSTSSIEDNIAEIMAAFRCAIADRERGQTSAAAGLGG